MSEISREVDLPIVSPEDISEEKTAQISTMLKSIENRFGVSIFCAIESGSRAWGFASSDSDYDVRFLYHHNPHWYVSAFDKKDTIDMAMTHDLDAAGWDVGKCMLLLYKGNATLHEWLQSPILYQQDEAKATAMRQLATRTFNPAASFYHYMSLAKRKLQDEKSKHNAKGFLYGMRALLCANYIVDKREAPPILFRDLCFIYLDDAILQQVADVLALKANRQEKDHDILPSELWSFAQQRYSSLGEVKVPGKREGDIEVYDKVMREILAI